MNRTAEAYPKLNKLPLSDAMGTLGVILRNHALSGDDDRVI
jgi:hypothetical protein